MRVAASNASNMIDKEMLKRIAASLRKCIMRCTKLKIDKARVRAL